MTVSITTALIPKLSQLLGASVSIPLMDRLEYARAGVFGSDDLGVLRLLAEDPRVSRRVASMERAAARALRYELEENKALAGGGLWLFVASQVVRETRTQAFMAEQQSLDALTQIVGTAHRVRAAAIAVDRGCGVQRLAASPIADGDLTDPISFVRSNEHAWMAISPRESWPPGHLRGLLLQAFPRVSTETPASIAWPELIARTRTEPEHVLHVSGGYDEACCEIDIFGRWHSLAQ